MQTHHEDTRNSLLDAALPHVAFDGWSHATFQAAIADSGVDAALARLACPRGAIDLAVQFHKRSDDAMATRIAESDLAQDRFRDRVAKAIWWRLEAITDVEAVRRAATLFALPMHSAEGARLIWGTSDRIWTALGDTSDDFNWYTKRATLSAVYGATVLFWLGDESPDFQDTRDFIDRRIDDVMRVEKAKAAMRDNPVFSRIMEGSSRLMAGFKPPSLSPRSDLPGHQTR